MFVLISNHSEQLTVAKNFFKIFFYFSAALPWESRDLALTDNKAGVLFSPFKYIITLMYKYITRKTLASLLKRIIDFLKLWTTE
jgi:hypothetical protein